MSGFVTSVLMLVLSLWLLEPMILLRNNLLSAARNPEQPVLESLKSDNGRAHGYLLNLGSCLKFKIQVSKLKNLCNQIAEASNRGQLHSRGNASVSSISLG